VIKITSPAVNTQWSRWFSPINLIKKTNQMKKDIDIQKHVMEELKWVPLLNANEIGVSVKNGIVTLSGTVDSYPKKIKAERAVRKVAGVRGIAEDIQVKLNGNSERSDSEIAQAVLKELEWHCNVDIMRVTMLVEDGCVTLEGTVDWDFQRRSAVKAISNIKGVRNVINNIKINAVPVLSEIKESIESAFARNATIDAKKIRVDVDGNKIRLSGTVRNINEKEDAEAIVWAAPGVTIVENKLECEESLF
jgi:osmotically-inducible protein OsmY